MIDRNLELTICGLKMSPYQRRILMVLASRFEQWVVWQDIAAALYANDSNGGPLQAESIITQQIRNIRDKLGGSGLQIQGKNRVGRRLVWADSGEGTRPLTDWTEEMEQQLLGMLAAGLSRGVAAVRLGVTRNAAVGKAYRLNKRGDAPVRKPTVRVKQERKPRPQREPQPPKLKLVQSEPKPLPEPPTGGILFSERFGNQCSYIYGDPLAHDVKCCGQRVKQGSDLSFCDYHNAVCTVPDGKQKKRRAA